MAQAEAAKAILVPSIMSSHTTIMSHFSSQLLQNQALLYRLVEDTAWHPVMADEVKEWGNGVKGSIFKFFLGTPLKLWASVGHWALWHFDINKFDEKYHKRVKHPGCWQAVLRRF